jgi:hypothetical protein
MTNGDSIVISQPEGLTLQLTPAKPPIRAPRVRLECLDVEVTGSRLHARGNVDIDPVWLSRFFKSIIEEKVPEQERWEYALGPDFMLVATAQAERQILLKVDLLATGGDECDWQLNATIRTSQDQLRGCAERVSQWYGGKR